MPVSSSNAALVSLIFPVYNEAESLRPLYAELRKVTHGLGYRFEYVFVDDGSTDDSAQMLHDLAKADKSVQVIEFSRNFGKEMALTAGIQTAQGEAAILLDADLQHPVKLIPEFLKKWRAGAEVVIGVSERSSRGSGLKRLTSWLYYKLLRAVSDTPVVPRATDFRLLDRVVIDAFNQLGERNRMTRGLIDWLGFRRDYVTFREPKRPYGQASYGFRKLFGLAVNSIVSLSVFPLRVAGWLGIVITTVAGLTGLFMLIEDPVMGDPLSLNFSGPAMLAVLNMFWIGIVLSALGLVALYIASIHAEVVGRPLYIVRPPARTLVRSVSRQAEYKPAPK